jgi:hypothetical protein
MNFKGEATPGAAKKLRNSKRVQNYKLMRVELPVHFRYKTQFIKTRLFENPLRSSIVGMGKRSDFKKSQLIASYLQAKSGQFGCVAISPR